MKLSSLLFSSCIGSRVFKLFTVYLNIMFSTCKFILNYAFISEFQPIKLTLSGEETGKQEGQELSKNKEIGQKQQILWPLDDL